MNPADIHYLRPEQDVPSMATKSVTYWLVILWPKWREF